MFPHSFHFSCKILIYLILPPPKSSHFVSVVLRTFYFVGIASEKVNTLFVRASFFLERDKLLTKPPYLPPVDYRLAMFLLIIKRMVKLPPFPCFTTTLILAIPDSRIHPLRVCRSLRYFWFCRDCARKSKYSLPSCFLFLWRNLFMIRFIPKYPIASINLL